MDSNRDVPRGDPCAHWPTICGWRGEAILRGGTLPEILYRQSVATFGEAGNAELINLVGLYCLVSIILNGFDVPVPETP